MVAGSKQKGEHHGYHRHFQKSGKTSRANRYPWRPGEGVRIVPEANRANDTLLAIGSLSAAPKSGPLGRAFERGRDYLSLKLDDPSFMAPIYANLFDDEDGEGTPSSGRAAVASATATELD